MDVADELGISVAFNAVDADINNGCAGLDPVAADEARHAARAALGCRRRRRRAAGRRRPPLLAARLRVLTGEMDELRDEADAVRVLLLKERRRPVF